jgi:hypothetical protein
MRERFPSFRGSHTPRIPVEEDFPHERFRFLNSARDCLRRRTQPRSRFFKALCFNGSAIDAQHFEAILHEEFPILIPENGIMKSYHFH